MISSVSDYRYLVIRYLEIVVFPLAIPRKEVRAVEGHLRIATVALVWRFAIPMSDDRWQRNESSAEPQDGVHVPCCVRRRSERYCRLES